MLLGIITFNLWLNLTHGVIHSTYRVALPVGLSLGINVAWVITWIAMYVSGVKTTNAGYQLPWWLVQMSMLLVAAVLNRAYLKVLTQSPVIMGSVLTSTAAVTAFIQTNVLMVMFNRADDGVRILIRLVMLPVLMECSALAVRFVARQMLHSNVSGASRGFLLLPVALSNAFIGRFFSTGLNSAALSYVLSFAVAALEVTMRYTAPARDAYVLNKSTQLYGLLQKHCSCAFRRKKFETSERVAYPKWDDLSPATQHARTTRAHYAFITLDTVAEDIGMLTLIPVAVFFRLPTRIGGQPLPLGDVLLRVGFQWLLELWTDVGPFVTYAACRAWLGWRGDVLYSGLTRGVAEAAARAALTQGGSDKGGDGSPAADVVSNALAVDSEALAPLKQPGIKPTASRSHPGPAPVAAATPVMLDDAAEPSTPGLAGTAQASMPSDPIGGGTPACTEAPAPDVPAGAIVLSARTRDTMHVASPPGLPHEEQPQSRLRAQCRALLPCTVQSDLHKAMQHVRDSRAPLLADDADVLWQRLPWTAVRAAMAPGAGAGEWSWLHWFTYRNELLAARMSASWRRRQRGWSVWVLLSACGLLGFTLRTTLDPQFMCPYPDVQGSWYWDACSDT